MTTQPLTPMADYLHLTRAQRLLRELNAYLERHREAIDRAVHAERAARILDQLPTLLEAGNMVWCRNGSVCLETTPCATLVCQFKTAREEVVLGAAACQQFQVTQPSHDWLHARQVSNPGEDVVAPR